ncbi:hypothetical protein RRG08_055737 [Elysia crispata]|uniref:Uncharacterized protein n=1 Tax=Elysia crispata TaxID=231223 RepID=A0AAE1E8L7_9GAST|nr:hypothetical protein RRG08_055737 [Elysia crispata]
MINNANDRHTSLGDGIVYLTYDLRGAPGSFSGSQILRNWGNIISNKLSLGGKTYGTISDILFEPRHSGVRRVRHFPNRKNVRSSATSSFSQVTKCLLQLSARERRDFQCEARNSPAGNMANKSAKYIIFLWTLWRCQGKTTANENVQCLYPSMPGQQQAPKDASLDKNIHKN